MFVKIRITKQNKLQGKKSCYYAFTYWLFCTLAVKLWSLFMVIRLKLLFARETPMLKQIYILVKNGNSQSINIYPRRTLENI